MKKLNSFKEIFMNDEVKNSFLNDLVSCLSNIGVPVLDKDKIVVKKEEENTLYIAITIGAN